MRALDEAMARGLLKKWGSFKVVEVANPYAVHALFDNRLKAESQVAAGYWKRYGVTAALHVIDADSPYIWHSKDAVLTSAILCAYGDTEKAAETKRRQIEKWEAVAANGLPHGPKIAERIEIYKHVLNDLEILNLL